MIPLLLALTLAQPVRAQAVDEVRAENCKLVRAGFEARVNELSERESKFSALRIDRGPDGTRNLSFQFQAKARSRFFVEQGRKRRKGTFSDVRRGDWVKVIAGCSKDWTMIPVMVKVLRDGDGNAGGPAPDLARLHPVDAALVADEQGRAGGRGVWAACERLSLFDSCVDASFGVERQDLPPIALFNALGLAVSGSAGMAAEEVCARKRLDKDRCGALRADLGDAGRHGVLTWSCRQGAWHSDGVCGAPAKACRLGKPRRFHEEEAARQRRFDDWPNWASGPRAACGSGKPRVSPCFCHEVLIGKAGR